jgi:hypothetical protein
MSKPSIKDHKPDRHKLGPTGPATVPSEPAKPYDEDHPNAGTVGDQSAGPAPPMSPADAEAQKRHKGSKQ